MEDFENSLENRLSPQLRMKLVSSLNTDGRWNRIIEGLQTYRIRVFLSVAKMNDLVRRGRTNPADWVLEELINRNCSFEEFCFMLREFDLLEELSLLIYPEPMVIVVQPGNEDEVVFIEDGEELRLACIASGVPRPTYQWYHENTAVRNQTNTTLVIPSFSKENIGTYWCQITQEGLGPPRTSKEVEVDLVHEVPVLRKDLPGSDSVTRGNSKQLEVDAEGYPSPGYQWYRTSPNCPTEMYILPDQTSNVLEIARADEEDEGIYLCRVYNDAGETDSTSCTLYVAENPPGYTATAKIALLIGNENYTDKTFQGLTAPSNDVATLAEILEELGFYVIALQNLTHSEMHLAFLWFHRILPENSYAFFYFAGHGCSKLSSNCVLPIDCPKNNIQLKDVWCEEHIKQILSTDKQLQLLVMLFDCCREEASDLSIGSTQFEHDFGRCNVVVGTSTRNYNSAYESNKYSNGLFVNRFKEHLPEHKPIIEILQENQKEFQNEPQMPTLLTTGSHDHSLRDNVEDNPEIEMFLKSEVEFDCFGEKVICFFNTNEQFTIVVKKHKNCFLNSIDLEFPCEFTYNFTVEVNSEDVNLVVGPKLDSLIPDQTEEDTEMNEGKKIVTIHNIQRARVPLCVTVYINGLRKVDGSFLYGPYDICKFDLDCPRILQRTELLFDGLAS